MHMEGGEPPAHDLDLDQADGKRNDQGSHEMEVLGPGPDGFESSYAWKRCTKNPGHVNFIPVSDFTMDRLPSTYQKDDIFNFVRAVSELTVKLRVTYTSLERPQGYAFSAHRGSNVPHLGTGCVDLVLRGSGPCPCRVCKESQSPCQEWHKIYVYTACHVLYNSEEAAATEVDFFYDDENSKAGNRMRSVWGLNVLRKSLERDDCVFMCAFHDSKLAMELNDNVIRGGFRMVDPWLQPGKFWPDPASSVKLGIVVVSHPHGQPKQITVGDWVGFRDTDEEDGPCHRFGFKLCAYRTDTCPGSSGAPVFVLGSTSTGSRIAAHSGFKQTENVNYSVSSFFMKPEVS